MKRFTETAKWNDPWYRKLPPTLKCLWSYLCDNCDQAGVWEPDQETAEHFIGEKIGWDKASIAFADRLETLPDGKWRILKFVSFQYGKLSANCKPHFPVYKAIEKHGLQVDVVESGERSTVKKDKPINTLSVGIECLQEEEKEKEKALGAAEPPKSAEPLNGRSQLAHFIIPTDIHPIWDDWLKYRSERRLPAYKPMGIRKQVEQLIEWGAARSRAAVDYSIRQNYQGIFEEKGSPNGNTDQRPNPRSYANKPDYSKVGSHGLERLS